MAYTYKYPAHYVSVDCVIVGVEQTVNGPELAVLLIERGSPNQPFYGHWALPGGFVEPEESLDAAAARELEEETGVADASVEQLHTFGAPNRDPRGRVITVAYLAVVNRAATKVQAGSDASRARWFDVRALPPLAFDHAEIIEKALARLREKDPLAG